MNARELNLKYWGDIHQMCEGTHVKPWECVRLEERIFKDHPHFLDYSIYFDRIQFAVAIANKITPLFVNDIIVNINDGVKFTVTPSGLKDFYGNILSFDYLNYHEFRKDIGYNDILQKLLEYRLRTYYSGEPCIELDSAINLIKELAKKDIAILL